MVLFAVVFLWTPPHYWPLAMRFRTTTPPRASRCSRSWPPRSQVARQIVAYSYAMVAASLLLWPVAGTTLLYPVGRGRARRSVPGSTRTACWAGPRAGAADLKPMRLFHLSISYLSLLFVVVAVDALLQ